MRKSEICKLKKVLDPARKSRNKRKSVKSSKKSRVPQYSTLTIGNGLMKKVRTKDSLDALIHSSIKEALELFEEDPKAFEVYHAGFQQQLTQWPDDPLQWIVNYVNEISRGRKIRIADMGCGDARLAMALGEEKKVYSFDLVAVNSRVTACDMAHVSHVLICFSQIPCLYWGSLKQSLVTLQSYDTNNSILQTISFLQNSISEI
ncbi:unnamed protein product [Echinostoma caproni]|uniref:Ribosomal RNA-processing protein 8 n=1 Tax=Echinostoma caproni TaxID=27848 RepID=A0A183BD77_9TREM|nr:unnamed protein product [Echinostoma caproni]